MQLLPALLPQSVRLVNLPRVRHVLPARQILRLLNRQSPVPNDQNPVRGRRRGALDAELDADAVGVQRDDRLGEIQPPVVRMRRVHRVLRVDQINLNRVRDSGVVLRRSPC